MAVGGLDLVVTGAGDHLGEGTHVLGREQFVGRHADKGAVGLDLREGLGDTSSATANVVAVYLVTDIEIGIGVPVLDELGGLVAIVGSHLAGKHGVVAVLVLLEKAFGSWVKVCV